MCVTTKAFCCILRFGDSWPKATCDHYSEVQKFFWLTF